MKNLAVTKKTLTILKDLQSDIHTSSACRRLQLPKVCLHKSFEYLHVYLTSNTELPSRISAPLVMFSYLLGSGKVTFDSVYFCITVKGHHLYVVLSCILNVGQQLAGVCEHDPILWNSKVKDGLDLLLKHGVHDKVSW